MNTSSVAGNNSQLEWQRTSCNRYDFVLLGAIGRLK